MKSGSAKLAWLAILLWSCSLAARSEQEPLANAWTNSGAWPSESHWVYGAEDEVDGPVVTNMYGLLMLDVWTQISTTNYIPDIPLGAQPTGWEVGPRLGIGGRKYGYSGSLSTWGSWWEGFDAQTALPGADVSERSWTNCYTQALAYAYDGGLFPVGGPDLVVQTGRHAFAAGTTSQEVTTVYTSLRTATNFEAGVRLGVPEAWAWDAAEALRERGAAPTMRFFRHWQSSSLGVDDPADLRNVKQAKDAIAVFCAPGLFGSPSEYLDRTYQSNDTWLSWMRANSTAVLPSYSTTSLLAYAEAPSNWFAYTPFRDFGGSWTGEGHVVESRFVLPADGVYTTADYFGSQQILSGTQGQVFVTVGTNANVAEGFTVADYGWKRVPSIINALTHKAEESGAPLKKGPIYEGFGSSWEEAKANCTNIVASADAIDWDSGIGTAGAFWTAETGSTIYAYRFTGTVIVDYAAAPEPHTNAFASTFLLYGLPSVTHSRTVTVAYANIMGFTQNWNCVTQGIPPYSVSHAYTNPAWCSAPNPETFSPSALGFDIVYPARYIIDLRTNAYEYW